MNKKCINLFIFSTNKLLKWIQWYGDFCIETLIKLLPGGRQGYSLFAMLFGFIVYNCEIFIKYNSWILENEKHRAYSFRTN